MKYSRAMPDLQIEKTKKCIVVGVDEAGRGPWAGPVVAGAVILDESNIPEGINDSKKISAKKRDLIYEQIIQNCIYGVGIANVEEIDELNILQATKLAMKRAVANLSARPEYALVDGNQNVDFGIPSEFVIKGDSKSLSIAAASIVAKVTRDNIMKELDIKFPDYLWAKNAGYGTKDHVAGLEKCGVTVHHRRSFKPIAKLLEG